MSKKDKKRIAELERGAAVLSKRIDNLRGQVYAFQFDETLGRVKKSGTIPSEKEQEEAEQSQAAQNQSAHCEAILDDLGHGETTHNQTKRACENLGEPVLNKPKIKEENQINAALKLLVDDLTKHLNFTLENWGQDRPKQVEMMQRCCDHFKEDLSDFCRKTFSFSELGGTEQDEQKEAEQVEPALSETEQKEAKESVIEYYNPNKEHWNYAIQANHMRDAPLYVTELCGSKIHTTPNIAEAGRFETAEFAQKQIADIKYQGADRGIKPVPFEFLVVLIDADKGSANLGGADKE